MEEEVFWAVGLVVALIYVVSPFPQKLDSSFWSNARIKSLGVIVAFPLVVIVPAWEKAGIHFNGTAMTSYWKGALYGILYLTLLFVFLVFVYAFARHWRSARKALTHSTRAVLFFLCHGLTA